MKKLITTILAIIGALCVLAFLLSCASRGAEGSTSYYTAIAGYSRVYEIQLSDGTQCAVSTQYKATSITCNWKAQ